MNFLTQKKTIANEAQSDAGQDANGFDGDAFKARAVELASRESDEMGTAIETVMKAKEDWQGGPIRVFLAMRDTYGDDLGSFPVPDSDAGNNPDKVKIAVTTGNKTAMRPTTFYTLFADATREGKAIVEELEFLRRAGNAEAIKEGIPKHILDMNPQQRENRENFLTGRRTTVRSSYKKAMALGLQMVAVNELKGVEADFIWVQDDEGNDTDQVMNTTKPIIVSVPVANGPVKKWDVYSIGSFLKLDPRKAEEKGGNLFDALKATIGRATGGATGNKDAVPPIKTVDTFVERFAELYRFANEMQYAKDQKDVAQLVKVIKSKGSDEFAVAIVEMEMFLSDLNKQLGLSKRYNELQRAGSDLPSEKAASKAA